MGLANVANLPLGGSSAPRPRKYLDTLHDPAWMFARYVTDGLPTTRIAALVGSNAANVRWALHKHGIPLRTVGEARRHRDIGRVRKVVTQAEMIAAYGGRCACCGETETAFLSLDHINGGGAKQRRDLGGGRKLLQFLRAAGWPKDGYRVLCMNCQFGTRSGRTCPHRIAMS